MAHPGQGGDDGDLHVLSQLFNETRRKREPDASPQRPFDFHQVHVDDVAGVQSGDAHGAADTDALAVSKDDVDGPSGRHEAGAVARQADQGDQTDQGHDHDQSNPKLSHRRSSAHPGSLPLETALIDLTPATAVFSNQVPGGASSVGP